MLVAIRDTRRVSPFTSAAEILLFAAFSRLERGLLWARAMRSPLLFLLLFMAGLGCGGGVDGDPQNGESHPEAVDGACDGLGRCTLSAPVLTHAGASTMILRGNVSAADTASSTDESVLRIEKVTTSCTCSYERDGGGYDLPVDVSRECTEGGTRHCWTVVYFASGNPGDADVVLADASSQPVLRIGVEVREAAKLSLVPRLERFTFQQGFAHEDGPPLEAAPDGAVELAPGEIVQVETVAFDGEGRALSFPRGSGFLPSVEDATVVVAESLAGDEEVSSSSPLRFRMLGPGTTRVKVAGRGLDSSLTVRVVPR